MSDRTLVSFYGYPDGKIELVDNRQPPGHTNKIIRKSDDWTPLEYSVGSIVFPVGERDDSLKLSGCVNLTVHAEKVEGGGEDVLDVMRSKHCKVFIQDAYPRGKYVTTQKGASEDIGVTIYRQHGHGKEVDHDYGNHADKDNGYTKDCYLSARPDTGEATVRVLQAEAPALNANAGPYRYVWPKPGRWHSLAVFFFRLFYR